MLYLYLFYLLCVFLVAHGGIGGWSTKLKSEGREFESR
jgi:hypothetical protein